MTWQKTDFEAKKEAYFGGRAVIDILDKGLSENLQMKRDLTLHTTIEMSIHLKMIKKQNRSQCLPERNVEEVTYK